MFDTTCCRLQDKINPESINKIVSACDKIISHLLIDDKKKLFIELNNDCSLNEYLEKYIALKSEINLWLKKTTKSKYKCNSTNTPYQLE